MKCRVVCAGFSKPLTHTIKETVSQSLRVLSIHSPPPLVEGSSSTQSFECWIKGEGAVRLKLPLPPVLSRGEGGITVVAIDDAGMRRMNRQFRGKNKTTDVLTFVYPDLVEIYISLTVARKQAREREVTLNQECQRLLVHGMCHAMGMDHHNREGFMEMRRREFEVLVQCDI